MVWVDAYQNQDDIKNTQTAVARVFARYMVWGYPWAHLQRVKMCPPRNISMMQQRFVLLEATFHSEVGSWPGVACEITDGKYIYLFEGMRPQPLTREAAGSNKQRMIQSQWFFIWSNGCLPSSKQLRTSLNPQVRQNNPQLFKVLLYLI